MVINGFFVYRLVQLEESASTKTPRHPIGEKKFRLFLIGPFFVFQEVFKDFNTTPTLHHHMPHNTNPPKPFIGRPIHHLAFPIPSEGMELRETIKAPCKVIPRGHMSNHIYLDFFSSQVQVCHFCSI
jgi:hypothetical protein